MPNYLASISISQRVFFLLMLLIILSGCGPKPELKIGIHPWIGYETLHLARDLRWLPPEINLHEGKSADDSIKALSSGTIDAACLTLDEVLRVRAAGVPLTILFIFNISSGADVVLARPKIKTLGDLAGKPITVENSALGALMLEKLLEAAHLDKDALTVIDLPVGQQQIDAWREKKVDAVITYEPTASLIRAQGGKNIFDTRQIPELIFDVFAVHTKKINKFNSLLHDLVNAHFRALSYIYTNREDAHYRIMSYEGISNDDIHKIISGISFPSLESNKYYLTQGKILTAARLISQLLTKKKLIAQEDQMKNLINPSFLSSQDDE